MFTEEETRRMADKSENKGAAADSGAKKNPMIMIMAAILVVVLIGAFVAVKQVSAKSKPAGPKPVEHGPIMPLDEFLVNLADPSGDHFLKLTVNLELSKDKGKTPESMKEQTPLIRDAVLTSLGSKTRDDVSTDSGRNKLKADIKKKVNVALGEDDVTDVYFSNFVTQ